MFDPKEIQMERMPAGKETVDHLESREPPTNDRCYDLCTSFPRQSVLRNALERIIKTLVSLIMVRKFGTKLSINVLDQHGSKGKSLPKKVKVRRGNYPGGESRVDASPVKLVTFLAGPVGIELEPCSSMECVAKVVRFVDAWPHNPGQARKCGEIKPGDLVLKAQAANEIGTTYDGIIRVLKMSHCVRELSFISAWENQTEELPGGEKPLDSSLPNPSLCERIEGHDDSWSSAGSCLSSIHPIASPAQYKRIADDVRQMPAYWPSSSRFDVSSPIPSKDMDVADAKVARRETTSYPEDSSGDSVQFRANHLSFSPSNVHKLTSSYGETKDRPRSLSKVIRAMYANFAPIFATSSPKDNGAVVTNSVGIPVFVGKETWLQESPVHESKMNLLQELTQTKAALDFRDTSNHELHENLDRLFRENVALHQQFEEKLRIARSEHAQTEHDLKKYYLDLCSSKESRIRELERSNDILRRESFEREQNARSHTSSEFEDTIGQTPTFLHPLKKWGNSFKNNEAILEEEMADLTNDNRGLLDCQNSLFPQLEVCQCSQLSKLELELHVLKTEKQSIQVRLHAAESELSTLKRDFEFATTALLDQAESQKCNCSTLKPIYFASNEHTSLEEDSMQRHACRTNASFDDRRRNLAPLTNTIGMLGDELITMEIFHKDELFLFRDTERDQMRQINRVDIEDRLLRAQKRAILFEIENISYKKQLVLAEKSLIIMKKMEEERDEMKLQLLSVRTELKDMEHHRDESVCLLRQALFRARRHMLHFDIEKRGWAMEKTRLESGLFHASRDIERLMSSQAKISRKLAESERDMEEMRGKILSLETEREVLVSEIGEMSFGIQELAGGKEEILLAFLKSLEKLEALQVDNALLSNQVIHSRIETGKIELELHEKVRKIDILETATQSLLREQRTNIAPRISLLKDLYKANVDIVSLRQTCELQRKSHQRDKEQLLLKMAKMSVCSGEFQKQNSVLRRELLALGTEQFRHEKDSLKQSRRERELVKQLVGCHLENMHLKRYQIESQDHLQQRIETLQAACIQVAFLKEAIDELNMNNHIPDLICQGKGGVQESNVSASYRTNDTQIASLQLTELVMARRTLPLKMSSLRRWHSFAFAQHYHHKSSHTSTDLTEKLTEAQRKISRLKSIRATWKSSA